MVSSLQAVRLCEVLLEQGPGCTWALRRDLAVHCVFGDSLPLFGTPPAELAGRSLLEALPQEIRETWRDRTERAFGGETVAVREHAGSRLFSITYYPVLVEGEIAYAGGTAVDLTPWNAAEQELRNTALNVLATRELERTRFARFLHDEVGQCLSAAGLQLDLLRMDLEDTAPEVPARTAEIQEVLERVMQRVREFSSDLNPATVERAGLYAALDRMVGRVRRDFPGTLRLMADSSVRLDAPAANAFYRIAEQALDNAIRHAGCTQLEVQFKSTRMGPALEIRDNGAGFDAAGVEDGHCGLGMLIMRHCAREAGIELAVSSLRGRGTTVRAVFKPAAEAAND